MDMSTDQEACIPLLHASALTVFRHHLNQREF